MTPDQFFEEAKTLARHGALLRDSGRGEPVAFWNGFSGDGPVISLRHEGRWVCVWARSEEPSLSVTDRPERSGLPLYAEPFEFLPPVDAVFRFGSDKIAEFLSQHGWSREDSYNDNFPQASPREYERVWQENCPMYVDGVIAVCGGWPFVWPDGSHEKHWLDELVVWTLADSEPWLDVFRTSDGYVAHEHIT